MQILIQSVWDGTQVGYTSIIVSSDTNAAGLHTTLGVVALRSGEGFKFKIKFWKFSAYN